MPSKHRCRSSSDDDSSLSDSYSSSSFDSEYHSKHRRKKKKSKHKKHKDKHRKQHTKSKHKKKSKSKSKSRHKHKKHHSKKRHRIERNDSESNTNRNKAKHKKRKLNPCTSLTQQQMIDNAKTVLNMFCSNNSIKQYMICIFTKLDNNESVSILNENTLYQQPLKMIFTFLSLSTDDDITYTKSNASISFLSLFKSELETASNTSFIGPQTAPIHHKQRETASSDFIGVTMPTQNDLLNNRYSSDGECDVYGPAVMNNNGIQDKKRLLQMEHSKVYALMNKKIKGDDVDIDNDNEKREEWMTTTPQSFLSDFDKGTKRRGFNMNCEQETDNLWTQTPADLKRKKMERKRIKDIQEQTNERLKCLGLPTVQQHAMTVNKVNDGDIENIERVYDEGKRKSLFEEHQERLMNEYKEELKEWKKRKKNGQKVATKPVFKGVKKADVNTNYVGSMNSYYNAQNPVLSRSKLSTFVNGGTIDDY